MKAAPEDTDQVSLKKRFGLQAKILLLAAICIPIIGGIVYISINTLSTTVNEDFEDRATLVAQFFGADTNSTEEISYQHFQSEIEKLD